MRQRAAVPIAVTVFAALMVGSTASTAARGSLDSDTVVVLFVDDLHIEFRSTPAVRDVLINRILPSVIGGGQKVGIVTTGYSPISLAPTSDRAILLARLRTITGGGLRPDAVLRQHAERIRRAQVALSVAKDTIAALAVRGTGRTLLIYLSDGYGEPELAGELEKIAAAAWRANATIYALDTRSLLGPDVELTAANWSRWDSHRVVAQDGLRRLAEGNEGQLIWTRSDLDSALQQIALTRK